MIVVGLMTGTSADGLDVAVVDLTLSGPDEGGLELRLLDHREVPFPDALADDILRLLEPRDVPLSLVSGVDARLGRFCADAVAGVLDDLRERTGRTADLVVAHGQTVRHDVDDAGRITGTLQIGQPAWIAERTGVPVLSDVRSGDVAAGGQGAPLASILDHLLLAGTDTPTAALNLGGIANITVVAPSRSEPGETGEHGEHGEHGQDTIAYDTGPANALIDLMARRITGEARGYDRGGELAAAGEVLPDLLADLLAEPYYAAPAPKSTGKELFHAAYLDEHLARHAARHPEQHGEPDPHDVVATLTVLTARTVADQCRRHGVGEVVASGGGTRNPVLMSALRRELGGVPVTTTDDRFGLPEGAKEATLMALLGWLTWHGLPGTLPSVTGAAHGTFAGRITPGAGPLRLPVPRDAPPARLRVVHA